MIRAKPRYKRLGGVEVTEEADEWLWNDVAAYEMVSEPAAEDGLEL